MFRTPRVHLGCTAAWRLIVPPLPYSILFVPTFAARCLSASYTTRELQAAKGGTICGQETRPIILPRDAEFHVHSRVLLRAVNIRHGTDGFTSPPKEGVLRIFSPLKIRRRRPGLNPRTWVLKAKTLPRSHLLLACLLAYLLTYILTYILTYLLTPWSRVLLEKLTGSADSQEIPRIFGTRRFLTVFTSARHLSLPWANSIQSPQPPPTSW